MSIQTRAVDAMNAAGIAAYLPGRAPGDCKSAHAVVADGGRVATGRTTGRRVFYVTAYVPAARPGDLTPLLARIADALVAVKELRQTGDVSEGYFDQDKGAYCAAAEYSALCGL